MPHAAPRFFGLDLIRLASFAAIAVYHLHHMIWYPANEGWNYPSAVVRLMERYASALAFSGFTVLLLTSFLHGLSARDWFLKFRLLIFLVLGWIAFSLISAGMDGEAFTLSWDIYPLALFGLLTASLIGRISPVALRALGFAGFLLLWIPFWRWEADFESRFGVLAQALVGICGLDLAEWPILPWVGWVWLGYALGCETRQVILERGVGALRLHKREFMFWIVALILSLPWLGAYFSTPWGDQFACVVFRHAPVEFFAALVWPVFLSRASLDDRVQKKLSGSSIARWVSGLKISTHFWVAYFVHYVGAYVYVRALGLHLEELPAAVWVLPVYLGLLPATEWITRGLVALFRRTKS